MTQPRSEEPTSEAVPESARYGFVPLLLPVLTRQSRYGRHTDWHCEATRSVGAEEVGQSVSGFFGSLFREKVSGVQGVPSNVITPDSPSAIGPDSSTYQV